MKILQPTMAAVLFALALPATAFECTNAGAGGTPPNDGDGSTSTACGDGANATGLSSTAVGGSAGAFATDSTALGRSASASGPVSVALGAFASSAGVDSAALGAFSSSTSTRSTALGSSAAATAESATAVGGNATASGFASTAIGREANASGDSSTVVGRHAFSDGSNSTALGHRATSPNDNTMVLGSIPGENSGDAYIDIANGTTAPEGPLHIFRDDATQEMLILESDETGDPQDRAMIDLSNNGGIRFQFTNAAQGNAWRFQTGTGGGDNFEVTKVGTGQIEFTVDDSGNATLAGMLFENSDRNAKTNIESINPDEVLAKLADLPISEWEYKDTPGQRHVGPMAQDFREAFGLGANDTSLATLDTSGVALASVKALHQQNLVLRERNDVLEERLEGLAQQVAALTAVVKAMPAQAARVAME